jgi:glutathione S-transferase
MPNPTLYHFSGSTCSQKVRMVLAEKGVEFISREIDLTKGEQHAPEYVVLNADHVVPTLVADGEVLVESTLICEFIDDRYPGSPLRSADPHQRYRAAALVNFLDTRLHGKVTGVLTHALLTRAAMSQRTVDQVAAYLAAIPDPAERALRTSLLTHGAQAPEIPGAIDALARYFHRLEQHLAVYPWLSGDAFGIADATVLPYVVRFRELRFESFWNEGARPAVEHWLDRAVTRPSFDRAFTDWSSAPLVAAFGAIGGAAAPVVDPLIKAATRAAG